MEVAVSTRLLAAFDHQRLYPEPSAERSMGELTVLELDAPTGDELVLAFDWKTEPGRQWGQSGRVAVVDDDAGVVAVPVDGRVWPGGGLTRWRSSCGPASRSSSSWPSPRPCAGGPARPGRPSRG